MSATDTMIGDLSAEIERQQVFQENLIEGAQAAGRDLDTHELELYERSTARISECARMLTPLQETVRITADSATRSREIAAALETARTGRNGAPVEYRSAGAYIADMWQAGAGSDDARRRLEVYERAAAHQTTPDNLGVIPNPVAGTLLNFIDSARPVTTALGPQSAPSMMFKRPRVTQHADAGVQTAEKTELVSRKMLIDSVPVSMTTIGGYVNVSRQNIDWSTPNMLDIVVNDLAAQYAIKTEQATCSSLVTNAGGTVTAPITPASTAADVSKALWEGAGKSYAATKGQGRLFVAVSPDMLGVFGALFAPVNPTNSQSTGFTAGSFGSGAMGSIAGIPVIMSPGMATGQAILTNTAAEEVYEQRIGQLQVVEPSVLGVQVAFAGYFAAVVMVAAGIVKLNA